jgi:hypothetical protein
MAFGGGRVRLLRFTILNLRMKKTSLFVPLFSNFYRCGAASRTKSPRPRVAHSSTAVSPAGPRAECPQRVPLLAAPMDVLLARARLRGTPTAPGARHAPGGACRTAVGVGAGLPAPGQTRPTPPSRAPSLPRVGHAPRCARARRPARPTPHNAPQRLRPRDGGLSQVCLVVCTRGPVGEPRTAACPPRQAGPGALARRRPACCRQGALPAAWRGGGAASSGLHNPEGACPTGLWHNSVCNAYTLLSR